MVRLSLRPKRPDETLHFERHPARPRSDQLRGLVHAIRTPRDCARVYHYSPGPNRTFISLPGSPNARVAQKLFSDPVRTIDHLAEYYNHRGSWHLTHLDWYRREGFEVDPVFKRPYASWSGMCSYMTSYVLGGMDDQSMRQHSLGAQLLLRPGRHLAREFHDGLNELVRDTVQKGLDEAESPVVFVEAHSMINLALVKALPEVLIPNGKLLAVLFNSGPYNQLFGGRLSVEGTCETDFWRATNRQGLVGVAFRSEADIMSTPIEFETPSNIRVLEFQSTLLERSLGLPAGLPHIAGFSGERAWTVLDQLNELIQARGFNAMAA